MTLPNEPEEGVSREDILNAWMAGLQGRDHMPGLTSASRAGAMLRVLVLKSQRDRAQADAAYAQGLIDKWSAMGLVGPGPGPQAAATWLTAVRQGLGSRPSWQRAGALALASLLLGIWVSVGPQLNGPSGSDQDAAIMRGAEAPVRVTTSDPSAFARQVEAVLQRSQLAVRRVDLPGGAVQLQARLPADAQATRRELAALGIAVPVHQRLDLVISAPR